MMLLVADVLEMFPLLSDPDLQDYYTTPWKAPSVKMIMMDVGMVENFIVLGSAGHVLDRMTHSSTKLNDLCVD